MEINKKIKELRQQKNIGQVELANKLKCSKGLISLWENNERTPTALNIIELAKFFNVSADYLLGLEDEFGNKQ